MNDKQAKILRFVAKHQAYEAVKKTLTEEEGAKLIFSMLPKELYGRVAMGSRMLVLLKPSWKWYYRHLKKYYRGGGLSALRPIS